MQKYISFRKYIHLIGFMQIMQVNFLNFMIQLISANLVDSRKTVILFANNFIFPLDQIQTTQKYIFPE